MTWFRVGGAGIPAALKNAMNAVLNKKFGTSGQNHPPNQWPDDVNLLGPLPEGTASGSVAVITDGADQVPIKTWNSNVDANVSGVSSVECTKIESENLLSLPSVDFTHKGVHYYTIDGVLYLDGNTVGETSSVDDVFRQNLIFYLPAGTYYLTRGNIALPTYIYDIDNIVSGQAIRTNNGSFTLAEGKRLVLGFYLYQKTFSNSKADIIVNKGSTAIP